jgi:hypothetical protein
MAEAKGSTLRATLDFIAADAGPEGLVNVLQHVGRTAREQIAATSPTDVIPFSLLTRLWHAADEVIGPRDPLWIERAGAHSIDSVGVQLYGGIVRRASPLEFLTQPIKLFRLYYHTGDMQVVEHEPGRAVLRLVDFDEPDALFCRRQTGGLRRALELAGGANPRVRHVRCSLDGDAFCEWELSWKA